MPVTYSALKFDKGMTPKVFTKDSATRIEHFDTITEVLRPFRTLVASANNQAVATTALGLIGFESLNGTLYAVGKEHTSGVCGAIYKWDTSAFEWQSEQSLTATNVAQSMLNAHAGYLFGIQSSRYLYRLSLPTTFSLMFYDCGAIANGFADGIVHSKDGILYFATDNKIHKVDSTGATGSLALTLPNANFRITSICEQGVYVNIVGYDVKSGESSSLLWDRDTSVVDFTESYALGRDYVIHNVTLLGTTFFIQVRQDTSNSNFQEKPVLIIKYLNGAVPSTLYEFPVTSLAAIGNLINCKYTALDRFYFTASVKFDGESAASNICFCIDAKGRLTIAQNLGIDTGTVAITGILRDGEAFWFGGGSDGAWNTSTSYTTVASYETNDIRSDDMFMNLDFQTAVITCEPLPASGQIILKARKNEETTFTTIGTYSETSRTKFKVNGLKAKNALVGLDRAKLARLRLESTVGAVITGFQAIFKEVTDLDV